MHHRIMVRKERESKNEIAGFGALKPPIPAISNVSEAEKRTPAQSLEACSRTTKYMKASKSMTADEDPFTSKMSRLRVCVVVLGLASPLCGCGSADSHATY